jgi:FkbM family methyltransferase
MLSTLVPKPLRRLYRTAELSYHRARGYFPIQLDGSPTKVDTEHHWFWKDVRAGRWEPETFRVFERWLQPDMIYVDIGAWIGPTVLAASRRVAEVFCIEPDPVAYRFLLTNIALNSITNAHPFNLALSASSGIRSIADMYNGELGRSSTSLLAGESKKGVRTPALTWSDWRSFAGIDRVDFVKLDIEGGEFELVPSMTDFLRAERPLLYLSVHAPFLPQENQSHALSQLADALSTAYEGCQTAAGEELALREMPRVALDGFHTFLFKP